MDSFAKGGDDQKDKIKYSGGMLILQPGYIITENNHQEIKNFSTGIGGILRFYFNDIFTAGIYGGTQRAEYNSAGSESSYISLGYGGPFAGISKTKGSFRYSLSLFAGMGSVKNLHIEDQNGNELSEAYLYKKPALIFSPLLSLDYYITGKLSVTLQGVCLKSKFDGRAFYNPVLQFGILFNR
ncbi:MAG: hypothetical protein PHU00_08945 [Bacteroidales bacterium]|nr:hypothetical protein [Bacteroidales bacterium]